MIYTYDALEQNGRLGNQLFQIAAVVSAAKKDGAKPLFNPKWRYRPFFSVPDEYFGHKPQISRRNFKDFGVKYYQEHTLWADMEDEIWRMFQPSIYLGTDMDRLCSKLDEHDGPSCAVHVRRGDYLVHNELFPFPGDNYYRNAIDIIKARRGSNTKFYVFSDDIPWCRKYFPSLGTDSDFEYIVGISTPVEVRKRGQVPDDHWDMFLMSLCSEHIIANSSFSWWGAFLSDNKSVIYPKRFWGPKVPEFPDLWKMFPPTWVGIGS